MKKKKKQAQQLSVLVISVRMGWNHGKGFKTQQEGQGGTLIQERYLPGQGYYRHHLHLVRRNLERNSQDAKVLEKLTC